MNETLVTDESFESSSSHSDSNDEDDDGCDDDRQSSLNDEGEDDDDDDDDGLLSYLFDKSLIRQHTIAILVALVASYGSYTHLLSPPTAGVVAPHHHHHHHTVNGVYKTPKPTNSNNSRRRPSRILKPTKVHHHHSYRRTEHLTFCPVIDFFTQSESKADRVRRVFFDKDDPTTTMIVDDNLKLFNFNFPKVYADLMYGYYLADDHMDDDYSSLRSSSSSQSSSSSSSSKSEEEHDNFQIPSDKDRACLEEAIRVDSKRSNALMYAVAYMHPSIETFYQYGDHDDLHIDKTRPNAHISVQNILKKRDQVEEPKIQPASLTYTGFTAKFINLSTKPLNLYWDYSSKVVLTALVQPFDSFATVTTPGNSFFFAPTYDKSHALKRWTMTADEVNVAYDPFDGLDADDEEIADWSMDMRKKYQMQKLNMAYGREYLATTQRQWLSMFPRPMTMHYMWDARYMNQKHFFTTKQTHFIKTLPTSSSSSQDDHERVWRKLDYADYEDMSEQSNKGGNDAVLNLSEYRQKETSLDLTLKVVSVAPRVFEIDNFLSQVEVDHLLDMAIVFNTTTDSDDDPVNVDTKGSQQPRKKKKKPKKKTTTDKNGPIIPKTGAWIHREFSPVVDAIYRRAADLLQIDESLLRHRSEHERTDLNTHHSIAEAIHMDHYTKDQGYPARHDCSQPSLTNRYQPNRFATIVFMLNDAGLEGGDLVFPKAINANNHDGIKVQSKAGKAVLYYNVLPDGNLDDLSHHSGDLVVDGDKWMGTLWVWDPIVD